MSIIPHATLPVARGYAEVAHQGDRVSIVTAEVVDRKPWRQRATLPGDSAQLLAELLRAAARMAATEPGPDDCPIWCDRRDHRYQPNWHSIDLGVIVQNNRFVMVGLHRDEKTGTVVPLCVGYVPAQDGAWIDLTPAAAVTLAGMVSQSVADTPLMGGDQEMSQRHGLVCDTAGSAVAA